MIAQYTSAGIVSELKRLAVPASVDSIPVVGDAGGPRVDGLVGRALMRAVDGLRRVLAIEWLTAARALDLRAPDSGTGHRRRWLRCCAPGWQAPARTGS